MKLTKKQLDQIISTLNFYQNDKTPESLNFIEGMRRVFVLTGDIKQLDNEIFKSRQNNIVKGCIDRLEILIDKAYDKKTFDFKHIDIYYDDLQFMERLKDDEKTAAAACIKYIEENKR